MDFGDVGLFVRNFLEKPMAFLTLVRKIKLKEREMRLLLLYASILTSRGLDASGKSTILNSLIHEDPLDVSPTLGFQIRTVPFFDDQ